eukprot:COSAG03_NODE_2681_length_2528_cov_19.619338_1_plen_54_part_00
MSAVEVTKRKLAEQAFAKDVCTMKGVTCADGFLIFLLPKKCVTQVLEDAFNGE